jgi:SacI homology domain
MRKHLHELISLYGDQVFINLLNQKGYEKPVKDAFERYIAQVCIQFSTVLKLTAPSVELTWGSI